jgi:hypothetical protein
MSVLPIVSSTRNSGVATRRAPSRVNSRPPSYRSMNGRRHRAKRTIALVLDRRVLVAVAKQLDRSNDQQQPEQQEHEAEGGQQRGADHDPA